MSIHTWEKQGLGKAPFQVVGLMVSEPDQCFYESIYDVDDYSIGSCRVCGIGLKNNYLIDSSDGHHFSVGCDCVGHSGDAGLIDDVKKSKRTRRQLKKAAERKAVRDQWQIEAEEKLTVFYIANREEVITLLSYSGTNNFINDIVSKLTQWGGLSESQVKVALKAIQKEKDEKLALANAEPVPITDQRIKITGAILSINIKEQYGYNGGIEYRRVGLILDDRGFKVWGTMNEGDTGDKIEFMCRVQQSDKDDKFGFFKRPTKIKITEE